MSQRSVLVSKRSLLVTTALAAMAGAGGLAHAATAETSTASAPAAAGDSTTVGEIVVTAEKREANLQDVPEQVTAFTGRDRNIKGISTVQDMTNFTPGLTYSSQLDRPAIRGLARSTNQYTADSSVAVYYDDFFSNSTFLVGRDDMLIDQVEVLVGPQGTLYGRNSIGGLINTISKRPTNELTGEVRISEGNFDATKVEGTISGPVPFVPNLTFRLSGYYDNQDKGYLTNVVAGQPTEGGVRHDPYGDFQLEYKGDKDDVWFDSYVVGFNGDRGGPGSLLGTPTSGLYGTALTTYGMLNFNPNFPYGGGAVPGSVVGQLAGNNPTLINIRDFAHNVATDITVDKAYTFTLHWTHHFDGFDVKYVTGYSQYHYELNTAYFNNDNSSITSYQVPISPLSPFFGDPAISPLTVNPTQVFNFTTDTKWWSHELTFSSTNNSPLQWIAGLYYYNETDNNPETDHLPDQPQVYNPVSLAGIPTAVGAGLMGLPIPASALAAPNPSGNEFLLDYQDRIQSFAGYGQVDYKVTSTIKLTAGLRYTFDWKHGTEETRYVDFSSNVAPTLTPYLLGSALPAIDITPAEISFGPGKGICGLPVLQTSGPYAGAYTRCLSDHSEALTGTAGVEWTPDSETLAYLRYNRGYKAFAFNAGFISPNTEAAPEHVDDIEVGVKKTLFDHTLVIDADAFWYNYTNDQVPLGVANGSVTLTEFLNVPRAVSEGIELTADWRPIRHLDLNLTYGLDRTVITSSCVSVGGTPTGACYEDALDPFAQAAGARPVGGVTSSGTFLQSVQGDALPQAPENKVAFNVNYTWEFDPGNLTGSVTYVWKDKSYASIFTRTYDEAPSWNQVDLRLVWSGNHDRYEIIGYVKNLFDTRGYDAAGGGYITGTDNTPGTLAQVPSFDLTPPRLYGVEFHYKF
jgi:iron complex outermembrane recepter protein